MTVIVVDDRPDVAAGIWQIRFQRFRQHRTAMASLFVLILLILFSLAAFPLEYVFGLDPTATDLFARFEAPSWGHFLGKDEAGRDVLIRLMIGGQVSLLIGILATLIGGFIGVLVGVCAGYYGGKLDDFLMRCTDSMIALPLLPLLVVLGAVDLTKLGFNEEFANSGAAGFIRIVIIISIVDWTSIARLVRAATLQIRGRDYVNAASAAGAGAPYIIATHILPNIATPIIVSCTLTVGRVVLFESVLSFLGFGVVPPTPSWGNMLNNAQELISSSPALAIYPGLLIFVTVIAVNFLGDGLQHAFDPKSTS